MSEEDNQQTRAFWDRVAQDWDVQVGDAGDTNRILNSDPVLWQFVGDVAGRSVLDAGCGTGYLSRLLRQRGANVTGIDFSDAMIRIARAKAPGIDYRVESCADLASVADAAIDIIVSNYVLMDTPDLDATLRAFHRVLKVGGVAALVFSHPCFPQGRATVSADGRSIQYRWDFPYFEDHKCSDPPWGHFTSDFIWFHRPLSSYWKAFIAAGFAVVGFEEPRAAEERRHAGANANKPNENRTRPYSVAFKLQKPGIA